MKRFLFCLFCILGIPALATNALLDLKDARLSVVNYSNRVIVLQPLSTPTVSSPSVVLGGQIVATNDVNGQNWYSNIFSGLYHVTVLAPPDRQDFAFLVTATNLGNINVADNLVAASTATFPAGSVAWAAAVTDQRYARGSNQPISFSQVTNALGYTPQPGTLILSNYFPGLFVAISNGFGTNETFSGTNAFSGRIDASGLNGSAATVLAGVDAAGKYVLFYTNGTGISFANSGVSLSQNGATSGQIYQWNGTQWAPVTLLYQPASANLTNWSILSTNILLLTLVNATNNDTLLGTSITNGGLLELSNYVAAITVPNSQLWTNTPIGLTPAPVIPANRFFGNIIYAQSANSGIQYYIQEPAGTNGWFINAAKSGSQLLFFNNGVNNFIVNGDNGNIDMIRKLSYAFPSAYGNAGYALVDSTGAGVLLWSNILINATNYTLSVGSSLSNYVSTVSNNATNEALLIGANGTNNVTQLGVNLTNDLSIYSNFVAFSKQQGSSTLTNISGASGTPSSSTFLRGDFSWQAPSGSGTVTAVGLAAPSSVFTVSGSPVTSAGTNTLSFNNQSPNLVFAGPASGGSAAPTFRALVTADLPTLSTTGWQLTGNASTAPPANFVGTTDNQPIWFKVNSLQSMIIRGLGSVLIGDASDSLSGPSDSILGGQNNAINTSAGSTYNMIVGGANNVILANGGSSVISGGQHNSIGETAIFGSIGGGNNNHVTFNYGTVPGGSANSADGTYSFAAGQQAHAENQGTFVWADSQNTIYSSTNNDSFNIRAQGGVHVQGGIDFTGTLYGNGAGVTNVGGATVTGGNLFVNSLTATNGITNLAFNVAGVVTNDASGGLHSTPTLPNSLLANSSITVQGSAVALGGSTLAVGSSPTFNLVNSTNLLITSLVSFTNALVGGNNVDFNVRSATTNMTGSITWTGFINNNPTNYNWVIRHCVNTSGGNLTVGGGTGWRLDIGAGNSYTVTNNTCRDFWIEQQTGQFTNMFSVNAY